MAKVTVTMRVRKRWFFVPVLVIIMIMHRIGWFADMDRAARWLCDHAIRLEVK